MALPKYYVGIDFGHGETSVSRVPGTNGQVVSRVPLRISGDFSDQKVFSAICQDDKGEWQFVWSKEDLVRPHVMQGFKGMIKTRTNEQREALCEFAKLVFKTILENDRELKYNPETGEANFVICIANPSDWRRQDPMNPKEYLSFFQEEAGIKPAKMCINESDAAFYTKYKDYSPEDKVFVIDLGSSTIDFTTYSNSICIHDCCWGHTLGAHLVEDKLVEYGYSQAEEMEDNTNNMLTVTEAREKLELGNAEDALSLAARFAKEPYFTRLQKGPAMYVLEVKVRELVPNWPKKTQTAFTVVIDSCEVDIVIKDYIRDLGIELSNAVKKLQDYGISPNKVLLSGGASRMPFVKTLTEEAFPEAEVTRDNFPEWVVSDGAARYAESYSHALEDRNKLKEEFINWAKSNLDEKLESTAVSTFNSILKDKLRSELKSKYVEESSGSLYTLESITKELLESITKTYEFKSKADSNFIAVVDDYIKTKLESIIFSNYGKKVTIKENFIDPGQTFSNVGVETDFLHDHVENRASSVISTLGGINWTKNRNKDKRNDLVNAIMQGIDYDTYNHSVNIDQFIEQAVGKIDNILHDNGLFQISE